jgi:hypothetical protein
MTDQWFVPVIAQDRHRRDGLESVKVVHATELAVLLLQHASESEVWLVIANDEQHIEVSIESARRLNHHVTQLLQNAQVDPFYSLTHNA